MHIKEELPLKKSSRSFSAFHLESLKLQCKKKVGSEKSAKMMTMQSRENHLYEQFWFGSSKKDGGGFFIEKLPRFHT